MPAYKISHKNRESRSSQTRSFHKPIVPPPQRQGLLTNGAVPQSNARETRKHCEMLEKLKNRFGRVLSAVRGHKRAYTAHFKSANFTYTSKENH